MHRVSWFRQWFQAEITELHGFPLGLQTNGSGINGSSGYLILQHAIDSNRNGVTAAHDVANIPFADWLFGAGLLMRQAFGVWVRKSMNFRATVQPKFAGAA